MKVLSRARPIRVAYLVEESEHWALVLDAITLASHGVWGGRFSLIVPCQDGEPIKAFLPWLEAYDPDLIYSYVDLSEKTVQALHESIYPSYLTRHEIPREDKITRRSFHPRHMIQQLTVETTLPFAALLARNAGGDHPPRKDEKKKDSDWLRENQASSLERSLQRMCKMGVVHQGFEVKCKKCLHRNWISVDALQSTNSCEVCHTIAPAPISSPWQFRLNGFLKEALRSHGILPLFWALEKRRQSSNSSFYFEGPLELFYSNENLEKNQVDAEIDLTIISDGIVEMLEVKSSSRQMDKAIKFAELAKHLRPDIATIAVMEVKSQLIEEKYEKFASSLRGSGIEPRLMTLEPQDFSDDPSLSEKYSHKIF